MSFLWPPVLRRPSVRHCVCPSVNFSHFHLLLQNHWANFNQTWHKASLDEGDVQMKSHVFQGKIITKYIAKMHYQRIRIFSRTICLILTNLGINDPWMIATKCFANKKLSIIKKEMLGFFPSPKQRYDIIIALSKCVNWFDLVSVVSDVAYRPLVCFLTRKIDNVRGLCFRSVAMDATLVNCP